jgi:transposase
MIQITPHMRILLAVEPVDFRKGIDGLSAFCRRVLKSDPFSGYVFIFRNRLKTAIKILIYDGQGFWLCQKRLSKGRFQWWPDQKSNGSVKVLEAHELQMLIWNGNPSDSGVAPMWRKISTSQNDAA